MDGLSGAASVVAVVSLAIQLAEGIQKLSEFWKAVQDAPTNVGMLFDELETLSTVLNQPHSISLGTEQDDITEKVLRNCQAHISRLQLKLLKANVGFGSNHFAIRKWSALGITIKKSEIESLRAAIDKAKSTLMISKLSSIQLSADINCHQQQQILDLLRAIDRNSQQPIVNVDLVQQTKHSTTMQIYAERKISDYGRPSDRATSVVSLKRQTPSCLVEECSVEETLRQINHPNITVAARLLLKEKLEESHTWSSNLTTPLLSMRTRSSVRKVTQRNTWGSRESVEKDVDYFLYPSGLLKILGMSQGVWLNARATNLWTYSIQTFNSVPENALIFDFCRDGNLKGIQRLLSRGEASLRDRDPNGRTPLWVAAQSLQLEVANFLMEKGADIHISDWKHRCSPISAIKESTDIDVSKKVSMISLFQRYCPNEHNETEILTMLGLLLLFYRPRKSLDLTITKRNDAALQVIRQLIDHFAEDDAKRSEIVFGLMQLYYDQRVLQWTLRNIKGHIHDVAGVPALHDGIARKLLLRDPASMKMIAHKSEDLHRFFDGPAYRLSIPPGTVTSLAMYQPGTFFSWRNIVQDLGYDIGDFVRRELEASPLKEDEWDQGTLTALFRSETFPDSKNSESGFLRCERCGYSEDRSWTKIDLPWRRYLRSIRTGCSKGTERVEREEPCSDELRRSTISYGDHGTTIKRHSGAENSQQKPRQSRELLASGSETFVSWPYKIVCSDQCEDGICVAWSYENDTSDEPRLPAYIPEHLRVSDSDMDEINDCPSKNIPGAFVE